MFVLKSFFLGQTASHESKGKGSVCVWDAQECCLLSRMDGCHDRAVVQVAFSPDGLMLLTVGQDNNYTHKLWKDAGGNWSRVELFATEKSDQNPVLFTRWTQLQNTEVRKSCMHISNFKYHRSKT